MISPYTGYELRSTAKQLQRQLEAQQRADFEAYTIVVLGGSVAANFSFLGRERLLKRLGESEALAGREIRVLNYARPAFKQPQQVTQAAYLFGLGLKPDLVINLDGFNELAVAATNAKKNWHPMLPAVTQWLPLISAGQEQGGGPLDSESLRAMAAVLVTRDAVIDEIDDLRDSWVLSSALLGRRALSRIERARSAYADSVETYLKRAGEDLKSADSLAPAPPQDEAGVLQSCVQNWRDSSISLHGLCQSHGVPYLHLLQPTLHDPGSKSLTPDEIKTGKAQAVWERSAQQGYPRLREQGLVLREGGVAFHDLSHVFSEVEETLYYDACHFRRPGHELLADAVADAVLQTLGRD